MAFVDDVATIAPIASLVGLDAVNPHGHLDKSCSLQDASSHDLPVTNAWKKQLEGLAVCPRFPTDAVAAPTASEVLDAEAREANRSRRLLSLKELIREPQGTELTLYQHRRVLGLGSWLCALLGHCIVAALSFLCWSLFFLRGSHRHEAISLVFTTMLLLQAGAAFLPAAEAAAIENTLMETAFAAGPQIVASAGASVHVYNAGEASPTPSVAPSPPSTIDDALPPARAPPPSGLLPTKLESAGNDVALGALVHSPARRLATTPVSPGVETLQNAVNAASAGDTLVLADGTYKSYTDAFCYSCNMLEISKHITIRAQNSGQAILDGENARRVIYITSGTVTLEGLGITKGQVCTKHATK